MGIKLFLSQGYSTEQANYGSSVFTGMAEGPTQWLMYKLCEQVITIYITKQQPASREERLGQKTQRIFKELLLNITAGAVHGAVWQLMYTLDPADAAQNSKWANLLASGALVGAGVGAANWLFALTSRVIMRAKEQPALAQNSSATTLVFTDPAHTDSSV